MRNRAKCKLCKTVVEAFDEEPSSCACNLLTVRMLNGSMKIIAERFDDVLGINDDGSESVINVKKASDAAVDEIIQKETDIIWEIDELIKSYDRLPQHAMMQPPTQIELCTVLLLMKRLAIELKNSTESK